MNYIYDIVLNLNEILYEFYEWELNDNIVYIKKIPLVKVKKNDLFNIKYNKVKVNDIILNKIKNKTNFFTKTTYEYVCLLTDSNIVIGVVFDKFGNVILRSSLLIDEEEDVLEVAQIIPYLNIDCKVLNKTRLSFLTRNEIKINKYIKNKLNKINDLNKLKYIYYECFNDIETDITKIKKRFLNELNNKEIANKLYDILRLTAK